MKNLNIISLLLFIVTFGSCTTFIEEEPKGRIDEAFLNTEDGLRNLVNSQYSQSRLIVERLRYLGPFPSDIFTHSLNGSDVIEITRSRTNTMPDLSAFSDSWRDLYEGINNMNYGLQALNDQSFSGSGVLVGELSFLRAWYYWLVVESWGEGAHYTIEPTSTVVTEGDQTTIDVFYRLILDDLNTAIQTLPEKAAEWGRISQPAAKALKSRAMLSLAGYSDEIISASGLTDRITVYTEVKKLADELINDYDFVLLEDYESIFSVYNEQNAEIIWSVQFTENDKFNTNGHGLHRYWVGNYNRSARTQSVVPRMYGHSIYYGREYRHNMMTKYFLLLFDEEDTRRDATIQTVWYALWDESKQEENDYGIPFKDGVRTDTVLYKPLFDVDEETATQFESRGIAIDGINHIYQPDGIPYNAARSWYHTMRKFEDPSREVPKKETSHKDVIILRLAEQYLIAAESAHFLGNDGAAAAYIDALRQRARKSPAALSVAAGDIDIDFILDERARELGGELIRWFDLKRTHKLVERVKKHNPDGVDIEPFHELRPVPQNELDKVTNRETFQQNPGYL
jgi:hypothetical protein